MSFRGMIEDVAVADVMQLIRVGGHTGSLTVNDGQEEGIIGFEHGRIVSAWNPRTRRVGELLLAAGAIDEDMLAAALEAQNTDRPRRAIGHYLVRAGATSPEIIRDVMAQEIERVVGEICAWRLGSFEFAIDDLTPLVEVTRFTGAPKVDLDTQTVLMDVLRRMGEQGVPPAGVPVATVGEPSEAAESASPIVENDAIEVPFVEGATRGKGAFPLAPGPAPEEETVIPREPTPPVLCEQARFEIVSPDGALAEQINQLMAASGQRVSAVALRDSGTSLLGEAPPIVVVDLRYQVNALATLHALCRSRPRAAIIALFEGRAPLREMYKAGVLSVTSAVPETVVACMQSAARQRKYMSNEHAIAEGIRTSFARLRRIIADLRSGLLGTSVSSNLMAAVAESLDRGVLLVPHLDRLVALGAFGNTLGGAPLSRTTRGLIFAIGESGVFKSCVTDSRSRRMDYERAKLPQAFTEAVDRPRTGEIAVLPVPGSERVIAAVYMDNGSRERPIGDIEIFELAAFQLGLALENEFLRRAHPTEDVTAAVVEGRRTG
jgi:hypothetical protein